MSENPLWSVTGLNEYVSALLAGDHRLSDLRVRGEISSFKRHSSGHLYFSIKDDNALVRCVMFRQQAMRLSFKPRDGMLVVLSGAASLYTRDGAFQLYARNMEPCGDGMLFQRFMELKDKLEKSGYFDETHKKPLPLLPRCVGVVTSGTGAALQDILEIIDRRFPGMPVRVCPCAVQGEGAARQIARAIQLLNEDAQADVLIVGRGGGSMEDLWAFNEKIVAEAIYESDIPIISAVGHETDFTIADFTADLRAPTPSAAAELAVPEYDACRETVSAYRLRMNKSLKHDLETRRSRVAYLMRSRAFIQIENRLSVHRQSVDWLRETMTDALRERIRALKLRLSDKTARISAMDPRAVLSRGYALLTNETGNTVMRVDQLSVNETVQICLQDGAADARICRIAGKDESNGNGHSI